MEGNFGGGEDFAGGVGGEDDGAEVRGIPWFGELEGGAGGPGERLLPAFGLKLQDRVAVVLVLLEIVVVFVV